MSEAQEESALGNAPLGAMRMLLAVTVNAIGIKQRSVSRSDFYSNSGQVIGLMAVRYQQVANPA